MGAALVKGRSIFNEAWLLGSGMNLNLYGLLSNSQRRAEDADEPRGIQILSPVPQQTVFIHAELVSLVLAI